MGAMNGERRKCGDSNLKEGGVGIAEWKEGKINNPGDVWNMILQA